MDLKDVKSVVKVVKGYTSLDTKIFEEVARVYLAYEGRKNFTLRVQNAMKTLIELHADMSTLGAFLMFHLPSTERLKIAADKNIIHLLARLDSLKDITTLGHFRVGQTAESVRKMFLAMSKDLRVVLVLMAIRYAELFDLNQIDSDLRKQIARQTLEIFVPITGRLGIYTLKRKLEDHCFSYLAHTDYQAIVDSFERNQELSEKHVKLLVKNLSDFINDQGIKAEVSGRTKSKYSTYMKLKRKGGGSIDEIYDLLALRVVVEKQTDCYTVLSMVNNHWQSITSRFKDYIAMPKVNGYRSLHTALIGMIEDSMRPVEIQIRTMEMHQEAEYGVAAHWWYEEESIKKGADAQQFVGKASYQEKLQWVKNLVNLKQTMQDDIPQKPMEFFSNRIFVMTLNGMVIELPKGSTPLDFAYQISDALGNHCSKAKINGEVVPFDYELKNGDQVFIVKKMDVTPNLYWLSLVQTDHAKKAIRKWLLEQGGDTVLDQGLRMVNHALRQFNHQILDKKYSLFSTYEGKNLSFKERKDLIVSIGHGELDADEVIRTTLSAEQLIKREEIAYLSLSEKNKGKIYLAGDTGFQTKMANCCAPSMADKIIGYVTRGEFISIHKKKCKVLAALDSRRCIEAWWGGQQKVYKTARIEVVSSLANMLAKLSEVLREKDISLKNFKHDRNKSRHVLVFDLESKKPDDYEHVLRVWKSLKGVEGAKMIKK